MMVNKPGLGSPLNPWKPYVLIILYYFTLEEILDFPSSAYP